MRQLYRGGMPEITVHVTPCRCSHCPHREGGVRQLYRGGMPEITGLIPRATAALSTLEYSRRLFRSWNKGELPTHLAYFSGALAGMSEGVAFSPFQVSNLRLTLAPCPLPKPYTPVPPS